MTLCYSEIAISYRLFGSKAHYHASSFGALSCIELWSGLQINYHKSSMILLAKRSLTSKFTRAITRCKEESLYISYLGVPIGKGKISKREWYSLINKMERRLEGWKVRNLSMGGWLILLNSILSAMPLYLMSIAILPRWVREQIDKIWSRFSWSDQL